MRDPGTSRQRVRLLGAALLVTLLPARLAGQADGEGYTARAQGDRSHAAAARATAIRAPQAIRVDGTLDEEAWALATPVTAFTQTDPREGEPVSERTEVRVAYDAIVWPGDQDFSPDTLYACSVPA